MQKQAFLILPVLFLSSASSSFAIYNSNLTPGQIREEKKEMIQELKTTQTQLREQVREEVKEQKQVLKENKETLRQQNIERIYQNILREFTRRYEFLKTTRDKIQARIEERKIKITSDAGKAKLTEAENQLKKFDELSTNSGSAYKIHLAALDTKINEIMTAEKPLSKVSELRAATKLVKTDLESLHKLLISSIKLMVQAKN